MVSRGFKKPMKMMKMSMIGKSKWSLLSLAYLKIKIKTRGYPIVIFKRFRTIGFQLLC